jgi:hypothetical protein
VQLQIIAVVVALMLLAGTAVVASVKLADRRDDRRYSELYLIKTGRIPPAFRR